MDSPEDPRSDGDGERRTALWLLALLSAAYLTFLVFYVPRLTNYVYSDREFTGWVGPVAEQLGKGKRLYEDLVLPIPPGSFIVLLAIQKLMGRAILLQELWVAALSHFFMGLIAYGIAARFATRRVALLVAAVTLVLVTQTPKVCVYDHTSLVPAWLGIWAGLEAALETSAIRRKHLWVTAGALATLTLAFKQSTAVGAVAGWGAAFVYYLAVALQRRDPEARARALRDAAACAAGGVAGLVVVAAIVLGSGATLPGFVQSVLRDGPALKGGPKALLTNLFTFTARNDAIRDTLVPTAAIIAIGLSVAKRQGHLHAGTVDPVARALRPRAAIALGAAFVLTWGVATALLASRVNGLNRTFMAAVDGLRNVPPYGFVFAMAFFVAHVRESGARTEEEKRRGHALNAVLLSSVVCSIVYDTSFVLFYPFYYNEPSIPVVVLCLFLATERSGFSWATPALLVLCLLPTYGLEFNRALSTHTVVVDGHWQGLRVNYRGVEVLKAARRARELAGENGTVLILPEDVQLAGLIQRPRPPLKGAILFVDQYPRRLADDDIRVLDRNLPAVIVVHPRRERDWRAVFKTWSEDSGTERVMNHVLHDVLPEHYERDSTFPTVYFWDQGQMDVYRRKDGQGGG